jgi:hypothetical protein
VPACDDVAQVRLVQLQHTHTRHTQE